MEADNTGTVPGNSGYDYTASYTPGQCTPQPELVSTTGGSLSLFGHVHVGLSGAGLH